MPNSSGVFAGVPLCRLGVKRGCTQDFTRREGCEHAEHCIAANSALCRLHALTSSLVCTMFCGCRDLAHQHLMHTTRAREHLFMVPHSHFWRCVLQVSVGGMAKGSGMIHPNMATMLGVVTSDASVEPEVWRGILRRAVDASFNAVRHTQPEVVTRDISCRVKCRPASMPMVSSWRTS